MSFQLPDSYWIVKQCEFMYMTTERHSWHFRLATKHYLFALWCSWPSRLIFLFSRKTNIILLTSTLVRAIQIFFFFYFLALLRLSMCLFIHQHTDTGANHSPACLCRLVTVQLQVATETGLSVRGTYCSQYWCWSSPVLVPVLIFYICTVSISDRLHGYV